MDRRFRFALQAVQLDDAEGLAPRDRRVDSAGHRTDHIQRSALVQHRAVRSAERFAPIVERLAGR